MISFFDSEEKAIQYVIDKNKQHTINYKNPMYCITTGPENDFATMTIKEAIENEFLYSIYW